MTFSEGLLHKIEEYSPPESVGPMLDEAAPVLIVGVTAAGKDTIINRLRNSEDYHFLISHTTRAPRPNNGIMEQDGVEYHFIDAETAERMVDDKQFIEVNVFSEKLYGMSVNELKEAVAEGKIPINDVEVQGVDDYMRLSDNVRPIFILPPDFATWQERFMRRYGEHAEDYADDIARRLRINEKELDFALHKDYFLFVVNDVLEDAVREIDALAHGKKQSPDALNSGRAIARALLVELRKKLDEDIASTLDD